VRLKSKTPPAGGRGRPAGGISPGEGEFTIPRGEIMSRGNQQSLIMLSSFAGCLGNLIARNSFARVDIKLQVADTFNQACIVIRDWPGDSSEDVTDAKGKIAAWSEVMGARQEVLSARTVIYIAGRILIDLDSKLKNRGKRAAIQQLQRMFKPIEDFVDPTKEDFLSFEEGDKMLDMLQNIIEWEEV
jgi:hypothetical protein